MQLKTKFIAPAFALLFLGMANSAYAVITCAATVTNLRPRETVNIVTGVAGDIVLSCSALDTNPTTDATVSISYGLPITNSRTVPGTHAITLTVGTPVAGFAPVFDPATPGTNSAGVGVSASAGLIVIGIPTFTPPAVGPVGTITVSNVLLSLAGGTVIGQDVKANINVASVGNTVAITGAPVTIIGQVLAGISTTAAPPALTPNTLAAQFTAAGASISATRNVFSITATENYIDAWRVNSNFFAPQTGTATNGTNVTFTFAGMLPGALIQNCAASINPAGALLALTGSGIAGQNGQATLNVELVGGTTDNSTVETITLVCGNATQPAYAPGTSTGSASTNVTFSVSQSPTGNNYGGGIGNPVLASPIPRFLAGTSAAGVTVIAFTGAATGQTVMILPWAIGTGATAPPAGTFDTGIAIANTTKNTAPFGTVLEGGATASSGNISFTFFPASGAASFTITPTTGFGLASGVIGSGGSFIGNLSEILRAGGQTGAFTGYVIIVANFSHAHGTAFVYGGSSADRIATNQSMLVIGHPIIQGRDALGVLPNAELTTN